MHYNQRAGGIDLSPDLEFGPGYGMGDAYGAWGMGSGYNAYDSYNSGLDAVEMLQAFFKAGTPLRTPEGSKPIEQFQPGDLVLSRSEFDPEGPIEAKVVEEVFVRCRRLSTCTWLVKSSAPRPSTPSS